LEVRCGAGWDGGLLQTFTLEVQEQPSGKLITHHTEEELPHFTVTGLQPGTEYVLVVGASNSHGSAETHVIHFHTPIDVAEKQTSAVATSTNDFLAWTPILGVLLGVAFSLLVCSVAIVFLVRARSSSRNENSAADTPQTKVVYEKAEPSALKTVGSCSSLTKEKFGPDVILIKE
ncbi:unnamed protein product, partial [Meganyctiphanes norvegica]